MIEFLITSLINNFERNFYGLLIPVNVNSAKRIAKARIMTSTPTDTSYYHSFLIFQPGTVVELVLGVMRGHF